MTGKDYRKLVRITYVILVALFCLQASALAQTGQNAARPDRGVGPLGSYAVSDIENISMTNGNLNLSIPLASLPPIAGGKLSWTVRAIYNSKNWDVFRREYLTNGPDDGSRVTYVSDVLQAGNTGGWRVGEGYSLSLIESREDFNWLQPNFTDPDYGLNVWRAILTEPDGSTHELRPLDYQPYQYPQIRPYLYGYYKDTPFTINPPNHAPMRYYSFDGSFIWAKIKPDLTYELYLRDGTHVTGGNGPQVITDTNSNSIRIYSDTNSSGHIVKHYVDDRASRSITMEMIPGQGNAFVERVTYSIPAGGTATTASVDVNFGTSQVSGKTYEVQSHTDGTNNTCFRQELFGSSLTVVKSITLPQTEPGQTRSFTFSYNSDPPTVPNSGEWQPTCDLTQSYSAGTTSKGWGSLSSMIMPSGASVDYVYKLDDHHELSGTSGFENTDAARENVTIKKLHHDGLATPDQWTYDANLIGGSVSGPDGSSTVEEAYNHDPAFSSMYGNSDGLGGLVYRSTQSNKVKIERHWTKLKFTGSNDSNPGGNISETPFNPVVDVEYTTVLDANGGTTNGKMSAKKFLYDFNGNLMQEDDYDWFSPSLVTPDTSNFNVPTGVPASLSPMRTITYSYHNPAPPAPNDSGANTGNVYSKRPIPTSGNPVPFILNAVKQIDLGPSRTQYFYDLHAFDTVPTKGNLTTLSRKKAGSTFVNTMYEYDTYGNKTRVTDPVNNKTDFVYDSATHAQPTSITVYPDPNNLNVKQITSIVYDFSTGLVTQQTDVNGNLTKIDYRNQRLTTNPANPVIDPFGRPGLVTGPAVTSLVAGVPHTNQHQTVVTTYFDTALYSTTETDLNTETDLALKTRTTVDQLGRTTKVENAENGSYTISAETVYKDAQRLSFTSNPHRTAAADTDGWTRATRDILGRVIEMATFSGAAQPSDTGTTNSTGVVPTSYLTNQVTVTDQAGNKRRSVTDALGRLVRVDEPDSNGDLDDTTANPPVPRQPTSYVYDVLGNLTGVTQGTQPARVFVYDALSRLTSATNPENGVTGYTYDDASNLLTRTNNGSPGTSVTFTYDGLNRVKTKTLSTGGVFVFAYDTATAGIGKLGSVLLQNTSEGFSYGGYDAAGRVTSTTQVTDGHTYTVSNYGYDLAGHSTSQTYPSGRVISTTYDGSGRINGVTGLLQQTTKTYADTFSYTAHGAVAAMKFGTDSANPRWEHTAFNSRLQPTLIGIGTNGTTDSSVLKLDYTYNTTGQANNNGNVRQQKISIGATVFTQDYGYDGLNRLHTATETLPGPQTSWSQTYDYDRWGNRWVSGNMNYPLNNAMTPQSSSEIDTATNRIKPAQMPVAGFSYDSAGNLDGDPTTLAHHIVYDAENHQTSYNNGAATYVYDGEGHRVKKVVVGNPSVTTIYVYNASGQMIAEYKDQATSGSVGTQFVASDHLGSTRLLMSTSGTATARYDYLPFGEEIPSSPGGRNTIVGYNPTATINEKFTGKERDTESGLDYFLARYYSSAQGRFTSVDPAIRSAVFEIPQSWNRYSYVINRPLTHVDPNGKDWYQSDKDHKYYWFDGSGKRKGYAHANIGREGLQISNVQGATGQYARYNNRNITLVNDSSRIVDRGPYVPPPAAELQDRSGDVGKVLLQFEGASALGAALIVAGGFTALDAAAWLAYTYLEKNGEGQAAGTTRNVQGGEATPEQALASAEKYLGPGYKEIAPGVFRSADGTLGFRMTGGDLTDPKQGAHVHFEYIGPDGKAIENAHVRIIEPPKPIP